MGNCSSSQDDQGYQGRQIENHSSAQKKKLSTTITSVDQPDDKYINGQESGELSTIKQNSQYDESDSSNIFVTNDLLTITVGQEASFAHPKSAELVVPPSPNFGVLIPKVPKKMKTMPKKEIKSK